jgi:protease IV
MGNFLKNLFMAIGVLVFLGFVMAALGIFAFFNPADVRIHRASILQLDLDGVITDGAKFLENLRRYRKDDDIKGILVQINSPGGAVGPSQEIFMELKRTREVFKKPVIASCLSVAASGAFYAAAAADKFIVTPGCMAGSIGVIMEFANLSRLYDWAKVERYVIKTGKFKDTGAEYRAMGDEERALLQELVDDVLSQFKADVVAGRKLKPEVVSANADGRVFTGAMAVKLGFADQIGTLDDARRMLGEMTGLGDDVEVFKPRGHRADEWWEWIEDQQSESRQISKLIRSTLHLQSLGEPLLIWPGALGR